jgi:EXLDI family protein
VIGYRLERRGGFPVEFNGDLLADETSRQPGQPRWTEIRIYRTDTGRYVVESVGKSAYKHEKDWPVVTVCDDPGDVKRALQRDGNRGPYLTNLAILALGNAGSRDPALGATLVDRI